jgi:hypothetical protein
MLGPLARFDFMDTVMTTASQDGLSVDIIGEGRVAVDQALSWHSS